VSADNYLVITKDFRVMEGCASTDGPADYEVGRGQTLGGFGEIPSRGGENITLASFRVKESSHGFHLPSVRRRRYGPGDKEAIGGHRCLQSP